MEKTILTLIDDVDQASAFAEYDVTSALLDTYMKSVLISESVQPTQEASLGIELNTPITGRYDESKLKKILMFIPRLLAAVIRIIVRAVSGILMALVYELHPAYRQQTYLPIDRDEFDRIFEIIWMWIDDVNKRYRSILEKTNDYVDIFPELLLTPGSGHKFAISEDMVEFPPAEITIAQETNDVVQILKSYDDGGKNQKRLFRTTTGSSITGSMIKQAIRELKQSAKYLIHNLNRANRYASGRTPDKPEDHGESEGAAKLREILPQFRSDIAYIMNFFTRLSTKVTEALSKQKVSNDDAKYDPDEFDDEE